MVIKLRFISHTISIEAILVFFYFPIFCLFVLVHMSSELQWLHVVNTIKDIDQVVCVFRSIETPIFIGDLVIIKLAEGILSNQGCRKP